MKRFTILFFSVLLSVCLLSCENGDVGGEGHNHNSNNFSSDGLIVSVSSSVSASGSKDLTTLDWSAWDDYMSDDIKSNGKVPSYTITPSEVILDICEVMVYSPKDSSDASKGSSSYVTLMDRILGATPHMVNVLASRGMDIEELSESEIKKLFNTQWQGLLLRMGTTVGGYNPETGYDMFWGGSLIGIRLPEGVTKNQILNRMDDYHIPNGFFASDDYVWIELRDLEPFNTGGIRQICFQTGIENPVIINPDNLPNNEGKYWIAGPSKWKTGGAGVGGEAALCLPLKGGTMDFSGYEQPEIRITFDVTNLIQLYAVEGGYMAYLNINNPYPISITCAEFDPELSVELSENQSEESLEDANPNGCFMYRRSKGMVLNWIRPNYEDINHIEITHNTVDDEEGAELIYSGNRSQFLHEVDDVFSDHYYWIYTIGNDGNSSDGVKFLPSPY